MPIAASDVLVKLSTTAGSAGNSGTSTPAASLGKYISTSQVSGTPANNVWDDVSAAENAALDVEYRCVFIHNAHATLVAQNAVVYISSEVAGGAVHAIAVDSTPASAIGASAAQALQIANEGVAPAGLSFTAPTTQGGGLALGNIPAGSCRAVWIRRTATNSGAVSSDGLDLGIYFETAP